MATDDAIQEHVAHVIKVWRKNKGMSQADLAEKLDMHQSAVAKIENMDRKIDFSTVVRIAEILGIPWQELKTEVPNEKDKLHKSASVYLMRINAVHKQISSLQSDRYSLDLATKHLKHRVKKAIESGDFPASIDASEVLNGLVNASEVINRLTPSKLDQRDIFLSVDAVRHLRHALSNEPNEFIPLNQIELQVTDYLDNL